MRLVPTDHSHVELGEREQNSITLQKSPTVTDSSPENEVEICSSGKLE